MPKVQFVQGVHGIHGGSPNAYVWCCLGSVTLWPSSGSGECRPHMRGRRLQTLLLSLWQIECEKMDYLCWISTQFSFRDLHYHLSWGFNVNLTQVGKVWRNVSDDMTCIYHGHKNYSDNDQKKFCTGTVCWPYSSIAELIFEFPINI